MEVVDAAPRFGALSREHRTFGEPEEPWRTLEQQSGTDGETWELVDVVLAGGAPWGFTLRGGLEYQEPLIITKVEEGSRAASAQLQVGDEIVSINAVPLSGYRQEAICLVKSSYRTLALGLKRRNEPFCRPHSWHSSKVSENPPEGRESDPAAALEPIWQTKYDPGSPSNDFTNCWGQTNLRQVSCKFSSVGNMEGLERSSNKTQIAADQSLAVKGLCKHDSSYSTPDQNSSRSSSTPTDCMFYRGSPSERHRYLQIPVSNGGRVSPRIEDQTSSRFSSSGRLNLNPVWHVPEKSSAAHSPPPPPPPLRSDSFAATKIHEKGLVIPYPHGPPAYSHQKSHSKGADRQFDNHHVSERGPDSRRSYNPPSKKDFLHAYLSPEDYNPNQLNPSKLFSLSSTDVRQGQNPFACQPQHQRQRSDESPFYLHPGNTSAPKTQTVGTYYRSLQHLPTNAGAQNQTRSSTASLSASTAAPDNSPEGMAHFRYYCITAQQPTQEVSEGMVEDGWQPESETTQAVSDWNSQKAIKAKYPPLYQAASEHKNSSNEFCKQIVSPPALEATSPGVGPMMVKSGSGEKERENPWKKDVGIAENLQNKHVLNHQADQRSCATTAQRNAPKDPWITKNEHKICPQKTPLLHSLAQESKILANSTMVATNGGALQEAPDPSSGKLGRRSDRYATTLRNEIQEKRAQLQKSRSAAALSCPGETDEDAGVWKSTETSTSSSDGSFSNTYKDHLKEAQARVLQATSFKRRDLELPEAISGLPSVKADSAYGQVSRIGSRKRFPMDKRVHSFSEPDKINEVGVEEKSPHQASVGSFVDRCKFFEGASRPAFSKPIPKKSHLSPSEEISGGGKNQVAFSGGENDQKFPSKQQPGANKSATAAEEQQRLGTFAEYEATWNLQKKLTEGRTSSRYRSAENILDSGTEERNSSVCIHERSRSSPSADFYGGVNLPAEKCVVELHPESKLDQQELQIARTPEHGHRQLNISEPLDLSSGSDPEYKDISAPLHSTHTTKASIPLPPYPHHLHLQDPVLEQLLPPNNTAPQKPAHPREDVSVHPKTTCPSNSLEALPSLGHSLEIDPHPAAVPGPEWRPENDNPFSTAAPPAAPYSASPARWIAEVASVPSEFSLQKLTDENPACMQHEDLLGNTMENTSQPSSIVKNVPTLVALESNSETEIRPFLAQREVPRGPEGTANHQLCRPCSPEQTNSLSHDSIYQGPHRDTESSASEVQSVVGATSGDTESARLRPVSSGHSEEDEKREELARDIMGKDKSLVDILDQSKMKTTMDLMEGIYPQGEQILEGAQQRKKCGPKQTSPKTTQESALVAR
ncbi:protein Shroom2 isoform X2 [Salminus brasiliensis]|uniref:protein Shroom2 isoform X2 n=1 Tax=Salminus brasiliensis TaxID=930266 RepID=UPI003B832331